MEMGTWSVLEASSPKHRAPSLKHQARRDKMSRVNMSY